METVVEQRPTAAKMHWLHELAGALEEAKQQNQYVLLDFFSPT